MLGSVARIAGILIWSVQDTGHLLNWLFDCCQSDVRYKLKKIDVTSQSGVAKNYVIDTKRLSAKDVVLSEKKVNISNITPDFCNMFWSIFVSYFQSFYYSLCFIARNMYSKWQ